MIERGFRCPIGIPAPQLIISDASNSGRQRREDGFARPRQPREYMLHNKRRSDRIECKGTREVDRIYFPPGLLGSLTIIVQKPGRIYHETKFALIAGKLSSPFDGGFVEKVDRWRTVATECNHTPETLCRSDRIKQCRSDSAAPAEDDCYPVLRKGRELRIGGG